VHVDIYCNAGIWATTVGARTEVGLRASTKQMVGAVGQSERRVAQGRDLGQLCALIGCSHAGATFTRAAVLNHPALQRSITAHATRT
jgi:hypothetical protein